MTSASEPEVATRDNIAQLTQGLPRVVRMILRMATAIERGRLDIVLPDGRALRFQGAGEGHAATMIIKDLACIRRIASGGNNGVAEAYLRGEWDTPDLVAFLELFCENRELVVAAIDRRPTLRMLHAIRNWLNRNTRRGARRNIEAHYDLGNEFYEAWLDRTMTYSSAIFAPEDNDLASAQRRKYAELAKRIDLRPEHHVLEIGCGWGGFAEYAAGEIGCRVTGLTISPSQHAYAMERMQRAGLSDRVEIKLQDYRDEKGQYDRIASIEMFEAVGEEYWPAFFSTMKNVLKPGGLAGIQVITIQDAFFSEYRRAQDFIQRYIFPGGMLPSPSVLKSMGQNVGLPVTAERIFGLDYARTLDVWRARFLQAWPKIEPMGFDERFRRLWQYYLAYCEAGFRSGTIDVRQVVFARPQ